MYVQVLAQLLADVFETAEGDVALPGLVKELKHLHNFLLRVAVALEEENTHRMVENAKAASLFCFSSQETMLRIHSARIPTANPIIISVVATFS